MYSIQKPATQPQPDRPVLVMLHGRGADERDLFGLSSLLDPRLEVHSLRAPRPFPYGGYTWFDLFEDGTVDETSFRSSLREVEEYIAPLTPRTVILFGFSMGAIMSYALALTHPSLCRAAVCLSGFAPMQLEPEYRLTELAGLDLFISHGVHDPVIPVAAARRTKQLLASSNARVRYTEYDMGHEINEACAEDVAAWLHGLL